MTDSTTIAPTDQSRAEFEAYWCIRRAPIPMNTRLRDDGRYDDHQIEGEWEAWQAARRAPALASQPVAVPPVANGVEILAFDEGLIEDELRRRQYPSNPRNAARSGWVAACRAMAAAPVAVPPGMEPGWQAVPVEPTKEMMVAAVKFANGPAVYKAVATAALEIEEGIYGEAYEAMLAAAPSGPAREPMTDEQIDRLVEESSGFWQEDVFHIGGPDLSDLLQAAHSITAAPKGGKHGADT